MAALHEALKDLGPIDYDSVSLDDLQTLLIPAFTSGQLIVDSVPISPPSTDSSSSEGRSRANTTSSGASSASEISLSSARSAPPSPDVEALQKEWKQVKLAAKENPLGMSVYKMGGKDGKGSWFARRSVHEGLGFTKWKKALEREFPETMKVQGGPGEGNIRGIGGETRVAYKNVDGVGKMEVYLLSAQFPGPTAPRDFVTMFLTSDQALSDTNGEVPRHFMVLSKPCVHPDAPPRDGYIRGQYESVEFIREIPIHKVPKKSASASNLVGQGHSRKRSATLGKEAILRNAAKNHSPPIPENGASDHEPKSETEPSSGGRSRGKTISFDRSRGSEAKGEELDVPREEDESETNPIEWIMITRSDPGGSVPRFLIDRGTPGGIVGDASKFLNWACGKDIEELNDDDETPAEDDEDETKPRPHRHDTDLHNYETNGHLAGLEEQPSTSGNEIKAVDTQQAAHPVTQTQVSNGGLYGMVTGGIGAAGGFIANHTPQMISDHFPGHPQDGASTSTRRDSVSSVSTVSTVGSFASALENRTTSMSQNAPAQDTDSTHSLTTTSSGAERKAAELQDKELAKLAEKKRKLDEKLKLAREKEFSKKSEDTAKEEEAIRKAEERHEREVKKQEEKYRREVEKLQLKKVKEERKNEERRRKALEKDERTRLLRELEEVKAEVSVLRKEKEILRSQVGDLQAENTLLAVKIGRLGGAGEEVLRSVREEAAGKKAGRPRASSLKGIGRTASFRKTNAGIGEVITVDKEKEKEKENVPLSNGNGLTAAS